MPRGDTERGERLARTGLVVAMALSALTILLLGRHLTFWSDELDWLTFGNDFDPRNLLTPHGSHLMATNRVIYEGLPRIFGTDYLPFRIVGVACLQACAVLVFVLVKRRMGALVALAPAVVLLFFGSAQEMTLSPLGIPFTLSIAFGLAAFLAVERGDLRGDVAAIVLLTLAGLSHTFGTIIAVGVAVYLLVEPGSRRRIWVAAVPIALWIAWWLWARQFHQSIAAGSGVLGAPLFILKAAGAAIEGMLRDPPEPRRQVRAAGARAARRLRPRRRRRRRRPRRSDPANQGHPLALGISGDDPRVLGRRRPRRGSPGGAPRRRATCSSGRSCSS